MHVVLGQYVRAEGIHECFFLSVFVVALLIPPKNVGEAFRCGIVTKDKWLTVQLSRPPRTEKKSPKNYMWEHRCSRNHVDREKNADCSRRIWMIGGWGRVEPDLLQEATALLGVCECERFVPHVFLVLTTTDTFWSVRVCELHSHYYNICTVVRFPVLWAATGILKVCQDFPPVVSFFLPTLLNAVKSVSSWWVW